ncbi:MAG: hypothetical protein JW891_09640 [Candidatus Lokiarchaeota archaeon]|nr:hypothetical protein [Candidatus Lokiarchaeota archaeon]
MITGTIFLLVIGIFLAQILIVILVYRHVRKKGLQLRDEMTRGLMRKSSEISFWASWILWIVIMVLDSATGEIAFNWYIYCGLIGMGIIFVMTNAVVQFQLKRKVQANAEEE